MDLVKWLTLLPWRQVHPYLCLASVNVEKSKKIVITNSDLYVTVIRLRYGRKEEEISPKIAPVVYVLLYIRSLNYLPLGMFACLDRPETIQGTLASLLRLCELKILCRSPVVCWLL